MTMTPKETRKCDLCKAVKDKSEFYSGARHRVCIACNSDFMFIKTLRRIARTNGTEALAGRIRGYMESTRPLSKKRANMARAVLRSARRGTLTNTTKGG